MRRRWRVTLLLAVVGVLAGCGADTPDGGALPDDVGEVTDDPVVEVDDNVFVPETITVETGTEVTWEWVGEVAHDVVGDGFESDVVVDGTFAHTFGSSGSFDYVCRLHPGMEGTVNVVPADR